MQDDPTPGQAADPLWTTRDAAQRLGVSLRTVQLWVEAGILPAGRTAGGHRRIRRSDVEALVRRNGLRDPAPGRREPRRVLLVESDPETLQLWRAALQSLDDIDIHVARSGYTALLDMGRRRPHVLVVDLAMPGLDGLQMLRSLADAGEFEGIRVIVITALGKAELLQRGGVPLGVQVLHKPISRDELAAAVAALKPVVVATA